MKVSRNTLRQLIREVVKEESSSLPKPNDLANKLSSAGAEATLSWLGDLLSKLSFAAAPMPQEELPPPPPPEPLPEDV